MSIEIQRRLSRGLYCLASVKRFSNLTSIERTSYPIKNPDYRGIVAKASNLNRVFPKNWSQGLGNDDASVRLLVRFQDRGEQTWDSDA